MKIDYEIKRRCVELARNGMSSAQVYREYFSAVHEGMSCETFCRALRKWKRRAMADDKTLLSGTYAGFTAHGATVQVNGSGEITQAWIRQSFDDGQWQALLDTIRDSTAPAILVEKPLEAAEAGAVEHMLEIPLYDMHFPISDHEQTRRELLTIIRSRFWSEINIVVGQDLIHNDDFRGRTASGRPIEKVDIAKAWTMARDFYGSVIAAALGFSHRVRVIYSKGNHDESISWAFTQMLASMFPQREYPHITVDDSLRPRKVICWNGCFIGITHGYGAKSKNGDLRGQFTIEFPKEFASASVREVHCGHLHHEKEADLYGVMLRRLSRGGETDEWSENEGYVGSHKRFMVFEWVPGRLAAIHYI